MTTLQVDLPAWTAPFDERGKVYATDDARMELAIRLARENVDRKTGGPFGAAIFERDSHRLVAIGVNAVVRLGNPTLHAEMVAFQFATHRVGKFTLTGDGLPAHELVTSCEPCAMCFGAILWSGVKRVVCGAHRDDASAVNFDEGPVFPESWTYLTERGIEIVREVRRAEARGVLELYRDRGPIYNG